MVTGIAPKIYKTLFPLWSLKKKDILKLKQNKKSRRGKIESIRKNLDIGIEKKGKLYIPYFALILKKLQILFSD